MGNRKRQPDMRMRMDFPLFGQIPGSLLVLLVLGLAFGCVWFWMHVLGGNQSVRYLAVEAAVSVLLLAGNIYMILKIGYRGFVSDFLVSWGLHILCSVLGFYMAGITAFWQKAVPKTAQMHFIRFLSHFTAAAMLAVLPVFLISFLMWLIMEVFGEDA